MSGIPVHHSIISRGDVSEKGRRRVRKTVLSVLMIMMVFAGVPCYGVEYSTTNTFTGGLAKIWIPDALPTSTPVKGVMVTTRRRYDDSGFRAIAEKYDFAMVRLLTYYDKVDGSQVGFDNFYDARYICDHAANVADRPELQGAAVTWSGGTLPVIWVGFSADARMATYVSSWAPDCSIAAVNYQGRFFYSDGSPVSPADVPAEQNVPVLVTIGSKDSKTRRSTIETNVRDGARDYHHAEWTSLMHYGYGHTASTDQTFVYAWLDAVVGQRLPEGDFDPDTNPLNPPHTDAHARGGDYTISANSDAFLNPVIKTNYVADSRDIWLPNQEIAEMWLKANTPYTLTFASDAGGSVSSTSEVVYGTFDSPTITATPDDPSYQFVNWTLDGVEYSTSASIQIVDVEKDATYIAHFKPPDGDIYIAGNATGSEGGQFADYAALSTGDLWDDSSVSESNVTLTVSRMGNNGDVSSSQWTTGTSGPEYVVGAEINMRKGSNPQTAAASFESGLFIAIKLDSDTALTMDSIAVDLWRNGSGSATDYQFAYDAAGDGYTTNDLIGDAFSTTGAGPDSTFSVSNMVASSASTNQEVRLYMWGGGSQNGSSHLYNVAVDYTRNGGGGPEVADVSMGIINGGSQVVVEWQGTNAMSYALQFRTSLTSGDWSNVVENIVGSDAILSITNAVDEPEGFYRTIAQP